MLVLASGDSLRGSASVAAVVDYSFHGLAGSTLSLLAEGQLPSADGELYPAAAVVVVKSIVLVNTHTLAVTINLTILKSASTARRLLPKNLSLPAGYMAVFDGSRFSVFDASGNLLTLIGNVTGLSGLLADDQHVLDAEVLAVAAALVHASRHQDTGADEISVAGLSGLLADDQHVLDSEVLAYFLSLSGAAANLKSFINAAGTGLEWATGIKVGSFTRDTSLDTGTQAVTGVGFKPSVVLFLAGIGTTAAESIGFDNVTAKGVLGNRFAQTGAENCSIQTSLSIMLIQGAGVEYDGYLNSLDSDGFTVTWSKSGATSGTATIVYLAFR